MRRFTNRHGPATKLVLCTHCNGRIETAARAMSVFCPHCRQRVILEDFKIRGYHAVQAFATCGDVVVERNGTLSAPIRVSSIKVKGQVWGSVEARERVEVAKTGSVKGTVKTPCLVVKDGGVIVGRCEIGQNSAPAAVGGVRG
jgi:DNA-directed RNA polymerase subunit RPC12/RpoP